MKLETLNGCICIIPESDIDQSFLCLWRAEVKRILEDEGADVASLNNLIEISEQAKG